MVLTLAGPPLAVRAQPGPWVQEAAGRLSAAAVYDEHSQARAELAALPPGFVPWWQQAVVAPARPHAAPIPLGLEGLMLATLNHSLRVRVVSDTPLIQRTAITEAQATFDPRAFAESRYVNTNEPVGSTLTTGGPPRYRDSNWTYAAGLRRKLPGGGQLELAQRLGYRSNNSVFLQPPDQGTSRIVLSFSQPLLNGAGRAYNQSVVVLAELGAGVAEQTSRGDLQNHLAAVTGAYWNLYFERAHRALRERLAAQAQRVLAELESRREIDVSASQIVRARAAVEARRVATIRAGMEVQNAEARLVALVNDPGLGTVGSAELIPVDQPARQVPPPRMRDSLVVALEWRPEILAAFQDLKAASVRLNVAERELLPNLALLLETYVAGLRGEADLGQAWIDQFSTGQPSYTVGLTFDVPWGNRAAKARLERQQLERRQLLNQLRQTLEQVLAEVEVAVREVTTAHQEMLGTYRALVAADEQQKSLEERWRLLPGDDRNASLYLEDLLLVQERVTEAEHAFLRAQLTYAAAWIEWKRATGTLMAQAPACAPAVPNASPVVGLPPGEEVPLPSPAPALVPPPAPARSLVPPPAAPAVPAGPSQPLPAAPPPGAFEESPGPTLPAPAGPGTQPVEVRRPPRVRPLPPISR